MILLTASTILKRKDDKGNERELHTEMAVDVINYAASVNPKTVYEVVKNKTLPLVQCSILQPIYWSLIKI